MKKIIMSRGTGKTTLLIRQSNLSAIPILCATEQSVKYIKEKACELGCVIPEPISVASLESVRGKRGLKSVLVDNAEEVLASLVRYLSSASVEAITISPEAFDTNSDSSNS